ncbi:MAG: monovalent cation/H+ antiporter complex subunit F [Acidimicrobiales bacterium]
MNAFLAAAAVLVVALVPCLLVIARAEVSAGVVAFEMASSITVMALICLAQGFGRSGEFELGVLLAILLYASGLVFARNLERWI